MHLVLEPTLLALKRPAGANMRRWPVVISNWHACSRPHMLAQPASIGALRYGYFFLSLGQVRVQAHARVASRQARSAKHEPIRHIEASRWRQSHAQHGVPAAHVCSDTQQELHVQERYIIVMSEAKLILPQHALACCCHESPLCSAACR